MASLSRSSTLTPCRSPTPDTIPVQPDHFYGAENVQLPPSPDSDGKTWLDPADDPLAHRGIPVFKPTMEEFQDFEEYMNKVECWGTKSGIVKIIPPKEWTDALPPIKEQLANVKIKTPIEQHMLGSGGLFRQENLEKRKLMSVREWVELCIKDDFRAPAVQDVGLSSRGANVPARPPRVQRRGKQQKTETVKAESSGPASVLIKEELVDDCHPLSDELQTVATPPNSDGTPPSPVITATAGPSSSHSSNNKGKKKKKPVVKQEPKPRPKRVGQTREAREASLADRAARDRAFLEVFEPDQEWLPPNTKASDYTPEFCQRLEREYWRNCGLGKPAWYGADTQGSLFTDETTAWNVGHLHSALSRLLPSSSQGLPGVNTPYLYFGMWRATFAWHVEDMDLFSINYIHFGAPKFWYAVPQGRSSALEQIMRGYFPKDTSQCSQFLRHKSFFASPSLLANSACRPNCLVQHVGEFVITYPRGYHAGFNLGLNCAESVNFALDSWLDLGRKAKACQCISDSVRIDVDQLLREREEEFNPPPAVEDPTPSPPVKSSKKVSPMKEAVKRETQDDGALPLKPVSGKAGPRKRKSDVGVHQEAPKAKKIKHSPSKASSSLPNPGSSSNAKASSSKSKPKVSITLKLGPRPAEAEPFPCCLCVSMSTEGLLLVHEPPAGTRKDAWDGAGNPKVWMAHEECARIVPETWVDEVVVGQDGHTRAKFVFGVDGIVKDRWNLKCSACTKNKPKAHGAPVQCTKGKCPKAFHVNCARDGHANGVVFAVVREVEKEVVLFGPSEVATTTGSGSEMQLDSYSTDAYSNGFAADFDPNGMAMPADDLTQDPSAGLSNVLKVIKKLEVQILCTQHNPAVAAQKKATKQDKMRADLLALPPLGRIKIRVSAGVFEVSLIRVIEETASVEVLWDRGVKREFKWGSVVFGSTEGPVQQRPIEMGMQELAEAEVERPPSVMPVTTFPSVSAATAQYQQQYQYGRQQLPYMPPYPSASSSSASTSVTPMPIDHSSSSTTPHPQPSMTMTMSMSMPVNQNQQPYAGTSTGSYTYPARTTTGPYDYWSYAAAASQYAAYPYNGYYTHPAGTTGAGGSRHQQHQQQYQQQQQPPPPPPPQQQQQRNQQQHYNPYTYAQAYPQAQGQQYRGGQQLNWQQPYRGPPPPQQQQQQQQSQVQAQAPSSAPPSYYRDASGSQLTTQPSVSSNSNLMTRQESSDEGAGQPVAAASSSSSALGAPEQPLATMATYKDLAALSSLPHAQIVDILRGNPQLRDAVVWAAAANVNQQQQAKRIEGEVEA